MWNLDCLLKHSIAQKMSDLTIIIDLNVFGIYPRVVIILKWLKQNKIQFPFFQFIKKHLFKLALQSDYHLACVSFHKHSFFSRLTCPSHIPLKYILWQFNIVSSLKNILRDWYQLRTNQIAISFYCSIKLFEVNRYAITSLSNQSHLQTFHMIESIDWKWKKIKLEMKELINRRRNILKVKNIISRWMINRPVKPRHSWCYEVTRLCLYLLELRQVIVAHHSRM